MLFLRKYRVTVGDQVASDDDATKGSAVGFDALDIEFEVHKNNQSQPDYCKLKVWNPPNEIKGAGQEKAAFLLLQAGYSDSDFSDQAGAIFQGQIRKTDIAQDCTNAFIEIEASDFDSVFRCSRIQRSFAANTSVVKIAEGLLDGLRQSVYNKTGLDVKIRQAKRQIRSLLPKKAQATGRSKTAKGMTFNGPASSILSDFLAVYDLVWVLQDGIVKISERNAPSEQFRTAVVLSPSTGLIGKPQLGEQNALKARSLLQADLKPFAQVELRDSDFADGFYNITRVKHIGNYAANEWYSDIEAVRIQ